MDQDSSPVQVATLLKHLREGAGLTLYELAKRTGINRSTLLRIEDGTTTQPDRRSPNMVARVLGGDPEGFYDAVWWQDTETPLPSPRVYLRSKYHLSEDQITEIEGSLQRLTQQPRNRSTKDNSTNERRPS